MVPARIHDFIASTNVSIDAVIDSTKYLSGKRARAVAGKARKSGIRGHPFCEGDFDDGYTERERVLNGCSLVHDGRLGPLAQNNEQNGVPLMGYRVRGISGYRFRRRVCRVKRDCFVEFRISAHEVSLPGELVCESRMCGREGAVEPHAAERSLLGFGKHFVAGAVPEIALHDISVRESSVGLGILWIELGCPTKLHNRSIESFLRSIAPRIQAPQVRVSRPGQGDPRSAPGTVFAKAGATIPPLAVLHRNGTNQQHHQNRKGQNRGDS